MDVEMPDNGTGNILTVSGLRAAGDQDGDQIDARANTVIALEREPGGKLTGTVTRTFELFDDGDRDGDGALEPDGVFGNPQDDLASVEGHYSFHARAAYGDGCTGARETSWSTYVQVGIDPGQTGVSTESLGVFPDGQHVRVTFCPRDRFGNYLGPGRGGSFSVYSPAGSTLIGVLTDLGQRCYVQDVVWDPASSTDPRVGISQPDRPPIVVGPPPRAALATASNSSAASNTKNAAALRYARATTPQRSTFTISRIAK
jgi:hypothetical protein